MGPARRVRPARERGVQHRARPVTRRGGRLRGLSGLLAAGTAVLAVALLVIEAVAMAAGTPGPGTATLAWSSGAAVTALAGQAYADRTPGRRGAGAAAAVAMLTLAVLAGEWLI